MAYPILAANCSWYKSSVPRSTITQIDILDSYTPGIYDETWNADADNSGAIKCYRIGTVIKMVGNSSGKISMNEDSDSAFSDNTETYFFNNVETISGADKLDTSNVTVMSYMFDRASSLHDIDVSTWNTSKVTTMLKMFQGCISLESIDLSNWNVGNVNSMRGMFMSSSTFGDMQLTSIGDISNWDTKNVTNMSAMFQYCTNLTVINVSKWDTGNVTNMTSMFNCCYDLQTLDVSNWNTSNVTDMQSIFKNTRNLKKITLGENFSRDAFGAITSSTKKATLPTPSSDYIDGADGNWYDIDGNAYTPKNVPNEVFGTYYASLAIKEADFDEPMFIKKGHLLRTASAIREKTNTKNGYSPDEFADSILSSSASLETCTVEIVGNNVIIGSVAYTGVENGAVVAKFKGDGLSENTNTIITCLCNSLLVLTVNSSYAHSTISNIQNVWNEDTGLSYIGNAANHVMKVTASNGGTARIEFSSAG